MKKLNKIILSIIFITGCNLLFLKISHGQVIFMSVDDTTAIVNKLYYYKVDALAFPDNEKYALLEAPENMTIDSITGEITWTPVSINDGGKVIVKATNSENEWETHEFFIYVAGGIECPSSVEAYWNLDEKIVINDDTIFLDYYGDNNAYITRVNTVDTAGMIGLAQKFSLGNNSEIVVPDDAIFDWTSDESFSIEFWFKMYAGDINSTRVITGRNQGGNETYPHWWIGLDADDHLFFTIRIDNLQTVEAEIIDFYQDYDWHHVVAVRNAITDKISLFTDGGLKADSTDYSGSGPGLITDAPLCIGWLKPGPGDGTDKYPYCGKLDELIFHNRTLGKNEIQTRYNKGLAGEPVCIPGNFAPLFKTTPDTLVNEESLYIYQYLAKDIDGDPLDYDVPAKPSWLNWNEGTRTLSGTPSDNDVGIFDVNILVNDGTADVYQNFQITVNNINDKPVLSNVEGTALSYDENDSKVPVTSAITVTDVDDINIDSAKIWISANYTNGEDVLAFTNTANITGSWNVSAGVLRLTGTTTKANYQAALRAVTYENIDNDDPTELTRTIRFTLNDGELNSNPVMRNVTVTSINDCPDISGHASLSTPEEDTILIKLAYLTFTDVDNNPGDYNIAVASGSNYTFAGNIVTPAVNFNGILNVNVKLSDLECTVDYPLPVVVTATNDPPEFNFASLITEAYENQTYFMTIRAIDIDPGDLITYSVPQKPDWLNVINDTIFTGIPEFNDVGANSVTIRISDSKVNVDTNFTINVNSSNYIPHITSTPPTTIDEDEFYIYNIIVVDTNSQDPLILSAPVLPEWLSLNTSQQTLEGIPTNDQVGFEESVEYTVKLRVYDGKQDSTQTFTIIVYNVNDAPDIKGQADTIISYPDSSLVINFSDLIIEDVDDLISELKLIILPGTDYALSGNTITIKTDKIGLINIFVRVEDPGKLKDQDTLFVRVAIPSGEDKILFDNKSIIKVYPTPAKDFIKFEILYPGKYILELVDITGKTVFKKELSVGENIITINTNKLPDGIYYYKICNLGTSYAGNIIIRK